MFQVSFFSIETLGTAILRARPNPIIHEADSIVASFEIWHIFSEWGMALKFHLSKGSPWRMTPKSTNFNNTKYIISFPNSTSGLVFTCAVRLKQHLWLRSAPWQGPKSNPVRADDSFVSSEKFAPALDHELGIKSKIVLLTGSRSGELFPPYSIVPWVWGNEEIVCPACPLSFFVTPLGALLGSCSDMTTRLGAQAQKMEAWKGKRKIYRYRWINR